MIVSTNATQFLNVLASLGLQRKVITKIYVLLSEALIQLLQEMQKLLDFASEK
jgi:hypothetical protein